MAEAIEVAKAAAVSSQNDTKMKMEMDKLQAELKKA